MSMCEVMYSATILSGRQNIRVGRGRCHVYSGVTTLAEATCVARWYSHPSKSFPLPTPS